MAKDKAKINKDYKPTDKEQDLREYVYKRKQQMEDAKERADAEREWDRGDVAWEAFRKEREDWASNYYVPLTTSVIESILSEMQEQIPEPFVLPRGEEDKAKVAVMQSIYEYANDVSNFKYEMRNVMRGSLIHGTSIAQEYYLHDSRIVKDIEGLFKKSTKSNKKRKEFDGKERRVVEYDDVMMEWINPWDILVDETATEFNRGPNKARDVIRRFNTNYDSFKAFFMNDPNWDHLNNARFVKPGGDPDYYQFYKPPMGDNSDNVEILWYWSRYPEDQLVIVANDVVLRMGPNIYKHKQLPFAKAVDVTRLGKFYGKGEPALLDSIQEEVNTMRRMIVDRNHLDIDKMFLVPNTFTGTEDDLIARPHGMIPSEDTNAVKPVEYNDIPLSVERTLRSINEDKVSVTGIDDRFQSVQKTPSTATEAAILKESTLKRIRMKLDQYKDGFLYDVGRMRLSNILQFYKQPRLEKIVGQKGTDEYKKKVAKLAANGMLEVRDGEMFEKRFRQITLKDKELVPNEKGEIISRKKPGINFFEAKPEFYMPSTSGYDVKFESGPELPVSKPLMQTKVQEMFDRLMPLAASGNSAYDPDKIADALVDINGFNPEEFKKEEAVEDEMIQENRLQMLIDLAGQENKLVSTGEAIPEFGTPFASPQHTEIHIAFLRSDVMKNVPQDVYQALVKHIVGELMAQEQRAGGQPQQGGQPGLPESTSGIGQGNQDILPARIEGGNQVPTGRALGNG